MKGRSHRLQSHDPYDDWVDGSWTVDCVCGVTFDDGEEMVNCDDCGVWVHTRCSGYVKGDESFTCDKCKSKNSRNRHSEETEVAQLLVELPTKTIRLDKSGTACDLYKPWIPMEDRVHVQGVPGGDPTLFKGLSSVFSPQLWKSTGYVPKNLNFRYREFPSWDDDKEDLPNQNNENGVDRGADALFSLSKESVSGMNGRCGAADGDRKFATEEMKQLEGRNDEVRHSRIVSKKEGSVLQPVVLHLEKRKREGLGVSKDRSVKKQARHSTDKELEARKRSHHASKAAFASTSDGKPLEFLKDKLLKPIKNDNQNTEAKSLKDPTVHEHELDRSNDVEDNVERARNNTTPTQSAPEVTCSDLSEQKIGKPDNDVSALIESSAKADNLDCNIGVMPVKQEGHSMPNVDMGKNVRSSLGKDAKPPTNETANSATEIDGITNNGECDMLPSALQASVKTETEDDAGRRVLNCRNSLGDKKDAGGSCNNNSGKSKMNDAAFSGSSSSHLEVQQVNQKEASDCHIDNANRLTNNTCLLEKEVQNPEVSSMQSESKPKLGLAEELSKTGKTVSSSEALYSQPKPVSPSGNENSTSPTVMASKPATSDGERDADRQETSRKTGKEHSRSSVHSTSKGSNSNKITHTSVSKKVPSDQKDSVVSSSLKMSFIQNSCETSGQVLSDRLVSHVQCKASASDLPMRGEKSSHSNIHSSAKTNHLSSMNPPPPTTSHAALSDEELALLLHQELNSSPRVPRVPRMRHAGSLPQLGSPTAASMLIKRTSSSGGKDHNLNSRRKGRDTSKGGLRHSHDHDDDAKKSNTVSSLPVQKGRSTGYALSRREEYASSTLVPTVKRNMPPTSTSNSGRSSSSEFNDHHFTCRRNSPRNVSDEDTGTGPVRRTLPGLINEIMSKGRRMTYEELCNAVLPHWHNLRKHNGERYAYASHSQAVLDCLRNRQEWAQLVDRGPKTSSSRKRRKPDDEETEDNDYGRKDEESKSAESQKEEVPKGKRKARKRRRLALQGRGIKDVRKRQKAEMLTDDDSALFSNSSDESSFGEDEIQNDGTGTGGSDDSASSDDTGTS